jgi:hypothetical protein
VVKGNERAGRLAGMIVISNGRAMDHADVLHALCEAGRLEDSLGEGDSSTMERLKNSHIYRIATNLHTNASSQREIVNRMRTGTVSRHMLLNVLKRKVEPLCVCPICKDANWYFD